MDFEEQLEKAEKLEKPSLVGSSLRSADDSPHQNYIHPEKYKGVPKAKAKKRSILNTSLGASLDDLISEGALLGSEEDFDRFLDDSGHAKNPTKFLAKVPEAEEKQPQDKLAPSKPQEMPSAATELVSPVDSVSESNSPEAPAPTGSIYESENYSTPNLSEYQLDHQISDHSELLDSVKSYDLNKLPSSNDRERAKSNQLYAASDRAPKSVPSVSPKKSSVFLKSPENEEASILAQSDSIHAPSLHRDGRSQSRPRAREDRSRSRSRSAFKPHLARGDSYKSTHVEPPTKYELPPDMALDEEEGEDRRTRQSKPTMGDSIAAAEAGESSVHSDSVTREPSLVTTGDYTNFNADIPSRRLDERTLYSVRSESSTNYLRSISRSRLRQPNLREPLSVNEKLDSNPHELAEEGALISDDPYGQMSDLDNMLKNVLKKPLDGAEDAPQSKNLVNDVPAEKGTEIKEQLLDDKSTSPALDDKIAENEEPQVAPEQREDFEEEAQVAQEEVQGDLEFTQEEAQSEVLNVSSSEEAVSNVDLANPKGDLISASDKPEEESLEIKVLEADEPEKEEAETEVEETKDEPEETEKQPEEELKEIPTSEIQEKETGNHTPVTKELEKEEKEESEAEATEKETLETESAKKGSETEEPEIEEPEKKEQPETEEIEETAPKDGEIEKEETEAVETEKIEPEIAESEKQVSEGPEVEALETDTVSEAVDASVIQENESEETAKDKIVSKDDSEAQEAVEATEEDAEKPETVNIETVEDESTSKEVAEGSKDEEGDAKTKDVETSVSETAAADAQEEEDDEEFFDVSPEELRKHLESLPVYLFTSLAGGMQIIQRTNRLATILQGNGVKYELRDLGTDEEAKKLWRRYAQGKTLPGVVRGDDFIGDWKYIDEINEDYRLHEVLYETI